MPLARKLLLAVTALFLLPLGAHAALHRYRGWAENWRVADWSSAGLLPAARADAPALVRVYAARTGRWYGNAPETVFAADGPEAERLVPKLRAAVAAYAYARPGDYRLWPGPNSNTFVAAVLAAVPEIGATLPPTAIGKDYPVDGAWIGPTGSRTGLRVSLAGYLGVTVGWVEGLEPNLLGAVAGLDLRRPAVKLPGFGRIGP